MYFDLKEIYQAANDGLTVFEHYFPNDAGKLRDPRHKFKIRDTEKTASGRISYYQGLWRITDFGNQGEINGMSPIDWIMYREGLQYFDAIKFLSEVILRRTTTRGEFKSTTRKAEYSTREFNPEKDKLGEYNFTFRPKATKEELAFLGRYITQEVLTKFKCRTVEQYEYASFSKKENKDVVHIFKATPDYPMYVFDYDTFKKFYKPMELEKQYRFSYIGEKPKNYIFGLDQLLRTEPEFNEDDEKDDDLDNLVDDSEDDSEEDDLSFKKEKRIVKDLFRCSGESDAMNMASLGFHVYWLNSESASVSAEQFREIDQYCERHYQVMDLDATGQNEAQKNALKHIELYTISLPEWIAYRKDWRGNNCKDLKDFINLSGNTAEATRYDILVLKSNARRAKFWDRPKKPDKEGKRGYAMMMEHFYYFLRLNGFYRIRKSYDKKADYMYVKIDGKVFRLISPSKIKAEVKRFTKEWIEGRKMMNILPLLDKINSSNQISEGNLEALPEIDISFRNYARGLEWLHFSNSMSMRITPEEIKMVRQDKEVPNHILGDLQVGNKTISHILPHANMRALETPPIEVNATPEYQLLLDKLAACKTIEEGEAMNMEVESFPEIDRYVVKINDNDFYFVRFLRDLSRIHWRKELEHNERLTDDEKKEENLALANLLFVYGYLCSEYKDPGKPWMVVTMDNRISEVGQSSGRSGKSLKTMGGRFVRPTFERGGRDLDMSENFKFLYDGYTEFHNNIEIDDFAEFGLVGNLYTQITGAREINPKNYSSFSLAYAHSGKMSLSTNFEMHNSDSSTTARILYETVSDYYHMKARTNDYKETRQPDIKFARRLYEDFTPEDWLKFYNIIAYSIQLQMRFYKINPPMRNIERREMRREMQRGVGKTDDFFRWANIYFTPAPEGFKGIEAPPDEGYLNCYIVKEAAYNHLTQGFTSKQKNDYRINRFKEHVQSWCNYFGYEFNPEHLLTDHTNHRIMRKVDNKLVECFYISTGGVTRLHTEEPEPKLETVATSQELPF